MYQTESLKESICIDEKLARIKREIQQELNELKKMWFIFPIMSKYLYHDQEVSSSISLHSASTTCSPSSSSTLSDPPPLLSLSPNCTFELTSTLCYFSRYLQAVRAEGEDRTSRILEAVISGMGWKDQTFPFRREAEEPSRSVRRRRWAFCWCVGAREQLS